VSELYRREAAPASDSHGVKPILGLEIIALDVNMRWLPTIRQVEVEAVGTRSENGWQVILRGLVCAPSKLDLALGLRMPE